MFFFVGGGSLSSPGTVHSPVSWLNDQVRSLVFARDKVHAGFAPYLCHGLFNVLLHLLICSRRLASLNYHRQTKLMQRKLACMWGKSKPTKRHIGQAHRIFGWLCTGLSPGCQTWATGSCSALISILWNSYWWESGYLPPAGTFQNLSTTKVLITKYLSRLTGFKMYMYINVWNQELVWSPNPHPCLSSVWWWSCLPSSSRPARARHLRERKKREAQWLDFIRPRHIISYLIVTDR